MRRRPSWTPYGITLCTMAGLLLGVVAGGDASDRSRPAPAEQHTEIRIPAPPEPAWVHTCVGLETDRGCP